MARVDASDLGRKLRILEGDDALLNPLQSIITSSVRPTIPELANSTARVLQDLTNAVLTNHHLHVDRVLVTLPPLTEPWMGYAFMREGARLAGIELLLDADTQLRPSSLGASSAANGIGLCPSFTKLEVCAQEEAYMPLSVVFGIQYTGRELTLVVSPFRASRTAYSVDFSRHWNLGAEKEHKIAGYWSQVQRALKQLPGGWPANRITEVVLWGDAALHDTFLQVLQDSLYDLLPNQKLAETKYHLADRFAEPEGAAACGAAEMAKRLLEAPEGCIEESYCDERRRRIGRQQRSWTVSSNYVGDS
ncbi:MAG: hypothetical protein M1828_003701 [Chrysothrix sp. TS-e1954]|nr:MAG: hypothetical protein M1828_003701 [Chrysothrix sp. TS-e1954]